MQNTPAPARLTSRVERGRSGSARGEEKKQGGGQARPSGRAVPVFVSMPHFLLRLYSTPPHVVLSFFFFLFAFSLAPIVCRAVFLLFPSQRVSSSMKLRPLLSGHSRRRSGAQRLRVVAPCGGQRTPSFRGERGGNGNNGAAPRRVPLGPGEKNPHGPC